jgi:hypothetical protein
VPGSTTITLQWAASTNATSYKLKRSTSSGGPFSQLAAPASTSYTDTSLTNGTTYYYVVSAQNSAGESPNSHQASATPVAPVSIPAAPASLTATAGNAQVALTWSASTGATSYRVKRVTTSGGTYFQVAEPTATSYTDSASLINGTTYYYVVSAVNSAGESANSVQAIATPKAPVQVGACNGLGAVDQTQDIMPPGASGALTVTTDDQGVVYLGTDHTGIFKSTDCGATWTKINTGRNAGVIDSGLNWTLIVNPGNPQVMYSNALYGTSLGLYRSSNGGKDWDSLFPAGGNVATTVDGAFFQQASLDPQDPRHILVTFHTNCLGQYAPSCMAESMDGGDTWRLLKAPTANWSEAARPYILTRTTWLLTTGLEGIYYSEDSGATWKTVGPGAGVQMYKSADGSLYQSGLFGVQVSRDGGKSWAVIQGTPQSGGLIGDGKRLFIGTPGIIGGANWTYGPESGAGPWSTLPSPQPSLGVENFAYDANRKILYGGMGIGGRLYRMRTQ